MPLPRLRDWIFSLKTFGAASLALYIGFLMSLPRPYWAMATVYICSSPLSGATRSKSGYRILGTLIGATVAIGLVPNLVNAPELLVLALAGWTALCLYVSLLDRTPRSYVFMLGGYTAALIGFPAVSDPGAIFDLASARVQEIMLGIVCASLMSGLILPRSVGEVVSARINRWLGDAARFALDTLDHHPGQDGEASHRTRERALLRLAGDAAEIDTLSTHLAYDSSSLRETRHLLRQLRARMLMLLPILSAIDDRMSVLRQDSRTLPDGFGEVLARLQAWIKPDAPSAAAEDRRRDLVETDRLRAAIAGAARPLDTGSGWAEIVTENLRLRLRDLVDIAADCRTLRRSIALGRMSRAPLVYRSEAGAAPVSHKDHMLALLSGLGVAVAIVVSSSFWILTGWPDGSSTSMLAAVACSFFSAKDDPAPSIIEFTTWSGVAVVIIGIYLFAILPQVHDFEMLILALAPFFIVIGLMISMPATTGKGLALGANGSTLMALQGSYSAEFTSYVNSSVALLLGMATAAVLTQIMRSVGAEWSIRRLIRAGTGMLAAAAVGHGRADRARFAGVTIDRLGLLAPRLGTLPADHELHRRDLLGEARTGINILDLRRAQSHLPASEAAVIEALLARIARHLAHPDPMLQQHSDEALARILAASDGKARQEAVLGLVGLRRALLPQASDYAPATGAAGSREQAAA